MNTNRKRSDLELLKALRDSEIDDDVAEVMAMSEAELDAYIRENGGDPDAIGAAGEAVAKSMHARRERDAPLHAKIDAFRALAAEQRARPRPTLSRAELLARLEAARHDARFEAPVTTLFRDKSPAASTDEELWTLLEQIELLAKLEEE
jgi:hypothetical protein